jgi:tRNA 5-methylaminomethyl-2-thiouridine biosynthesis bifunctional protein
VTAEDVFQHDEFASGFARVPDGSHFVVAEIGFGEGARFLAAWQLWRQANKQPHACLHFIAFESKPLTREALEIALERFSGHAPLAVELTDNYPPPVSGTHRLVLDGGRVRLTLCIGDINAALNTLTFTADAWFFNGFTPDNHPQIRQEPTAASGDSLSEPEHIGIIGAGIAGCLAAENLAGRGFRVTLVDKADAVGAGASGNRQGALYVKLGVDFNDQTQLALSALLHSQRFYQRFRGDGWHPTGLIQLAYSAAEADRQARFLAKNRYPESVFKAVNAEEASRIAGIPVQHDGLWFPASGWLQPARLCTILASHPAVNHCLGFSVDKLINNNGRWKLTSHQGTTLDFDRILICAGSATPELIPLEGEYRIKSIRGQITDVPERHVNSPSAVVCGPGYINPAFNGSALVGATFDLHDSCPDVTTRSNRENLEMLADLLPGALDPSGLADAAQHSHGRVAFRCATHDYQPIAGPMKTRDGEPLNGIYLFTGLGSKGLTYSPLLAEYLGDLLSGQPPCLPENLVKRVETQRCHKPDPGK